MSGNRRWVSVRYPTCTNSLRGRVAWRQGSVIVVNGRFVAVSGQAGFGRGRREAAFRLSKNAMAVHADVAGVHGPPTIGHFSGLRPSLHDSLPSRQIAESTKVFLTISNVPQGAAAEGIKINCG